VIIQNNCFTIMALINILYKKLNGLKNDQMD
jgi:hypothetical protein